MTPEFLGSVEALERPGNGWTGLACESRGAPVVWGGPVWTRAHCPHCGGHVSLWFLAFVNSALAVCLGGRHVWRL